MGIVSLKQCRECHARAPLGDEIMHEPSCSGDAICDLVRGTWPLEPGDVIVIITPEVLQ